MYGTSHPFESLLIPISKTLQCVESMNDKNASESIAYIRACGFSGFSITQSSSVSTLLVASPLPPINSGPLWRNSFSLAGTVNPRPKVTMTTRIRFHRSSLFTRSSIAHLFSSWCQTGLEFISQEFFKSVSRQLTIRQNFVQQPRSNIFTQMNGYDRGTTIWMTQKMMATPNSDNIETSLLQGGEDLVATEA